MGEGELCPFLCNITIIIIISKRTHEKTLVFSHALRTWEDYFIVDKAERLILYLNHRNKAERLKKSN